MLLVWLKDAATQLALKTMEAYIECIVKTPLEVCRADNVKHLVSRHVTTDKDAHDVLKSSSYSGRHSFDGDVPTRDTGRELRQHIRKDAVRRERRTALKRSPRAGALIDMRQTDQQLHDDFDKRRLWR
eukprot:6182615-Pleurochrysis_carterae.AAC.1